MKIRAARDFAVTLVGLHYRSGSEYVLDRPHGLGEEFLFVTFHTPIEVTSFGRTTREAPGACVIFEPKAAYRYCEFEKGFDNSFIHFRGAHAMKLLRRYELPLNEPFHPRRAEFIIPILDELKIELERRLNGGRRAMELDFERLLLLLSRYMGEGAGPVLSAQEQARFADFKNVRSEVHRQVERRWTVAAMAKLAHLSASRFSVLYRKFFGASPLEDLLCVRLEKAKWLLSQSPLPVKKVAGQCGFQNICYFTRLFHRRVGCAPREY